MIQQCLVLFAILSSVRFVRVKLRLFKIVCSQVHSSDHFVLKDQHFRYDVSETETKLRGLSSRKNYTDHLLSAKLVANFTDTGCHVVRVTDPYGRTLGFLDRSRCFFFQVAPQLYSRGWVDPVPDPLLLRKSGSAANRTRTSGFVARNSDH
jgi:hypothetical protein